MPNRTASTMTAAATADVPVALLTPLTSDDTGSPVTAEGGFSINGNAIVGM